MLETLMEKRNRRHEKVQQVRRRIRLLQMLLNYCVLCSAVVDLVLT